MNSFMNVIVGTAFTIPLLGLEPRSSDLYSVVVHVRVVMMCLWNYRNGQGVSHRSGGSVVRYTLFNIRVVMMYLWNYRNGQGVSHRSGGSVVRYTLFNSTASTAQIM
jgi:hypothetical protein